MARRFLKTRKTKVFSAFLVFGIGCLLYAYFIEPYNLEITRHQITAPIQTPIKIAHLTDLHSNGIGRLERKLLAILETEKPDLILLSGDQISTDRDYEGCRELLKQFNAPLGVVVVPGNHENWFPPKAGRNYFESLGLKYLVNQNLKITDGVWVLGMDDAMTGHPDVNRAQINVPESAFKIGLFHSPALFEEVAGRCDLIFAGHSHGGQVRLPFIAPFWLPRGCNDFVEGWFERKGSKMYVSRGLGMSVLPLRFNCRPEVAIITLGG